MHPKHEKDTYKINGGYCQMAGYNIHNIGDNIAYTVATSQTFSRNRRMWYIRSNVEKKNQLENLRIQFK
jgi:hypothetical protein